MILDESFSFSNPEESQFVGEFSDGLWAKSEPVLSMSAFQKPPQAALLDYGSTRPLHDVVPYSTYSQPPYMAAQLAPSPMADQTSQVPDCVPYLANQDYAGSYEGPRSARQVPEIVTYAPQRGYEGTRIFVQLLSPYDLHASSYASLYLCFGSKKCECVPHFIGFQYSAFQYALYVDAPSFLSTGSSSFAVPLQVTIATQEECNAIVLQVGIYTYEQAAHPSPPDESRKRRISSFSETSGPRPVKKSSGQNLQLKEQADGYTYQDQRSASYSPYVQPLPAMNGYMAPYHPASSPRAGTVQYPGVSRTPPSTIRAHSPLTPSWSPSFASLNNDGRTPGLANYQGLHQQKAPSPAGGSNPTLIRTSTLQQASGLGHVQAFNPYAIYPSKATLKLNGDLDAMTENWTKEERDAKRRLVQFNRMQSGSTIHADFRPVAPEDRAPNSICISCIHWDGKDECFVTSVDTIYLLESLVGVRFTVEEKNRIRRNLEGFRPLTVSKAKLDSEDFFKVIMGFPAPKPRNIEKDVKVFPWKILGHALKKIIGKYSASYSSTAGALPSPAGPGFASSTATPASDSGGETQTAGSPQSAESTPSTTYGATVIAAAYPSQMEQTGMPLSGPPELRTILNNSGQPYSSMAAPFSYPAICQPQSHHGHTAHVHRRSWDVSTLAASTPITAPSSSTSGYDGIVSMTYSLPESANGP